MKYYFFLISKEEEEDPSKMGWTYLQKNRDKWITAPEGVSNYLTAGYVTGVDYVAHEGKAYFIRKSFISIEDDSVIILCVESIQGCDTQ